MRTPMKATYPRVKVLCDPKAEPPDNFYVEITIREKGMVIETWRTTNSKAQVVAQGMRTALEAGNGKEAVPA